MAHSRQTGKFQIREISAIPHFKTSVPPIPMSMNTLKAGGVQLGEEDNAPTWHTLETLSALDMGAQVALCQELQDCFQQEGEDLPTYKARVAARWSTASVNLLLDAEKAWRVKADKPKAKLAKAGTTFMRFQRWGAAFKGRLTVDRAKAKVISLKRQEGADASEPPLDGLSMPIDTAEKVDLRRAQVLSALSVAMAATPSAYRAAKALQRWGTPAAWESILGPHVERAYWAALTSQAALTYKTQDSVLPACSRTGCKRRSTEASSLAEHPTMGAVPLCDECVTECTTAQAAIHERRNPEHAK